MIRLAFVIPTLDQSGAERQLTLLAEGLPRSIYEVAVFALNRGGHYADRLKAAGIPVEVIGKRFRFDPLTWLRLRNRLREYRPDLIQSFLFSANTYVRLPGLCPPGARIIVSERCVDSWKTGWQLRLDKALIRRTDIMTANSAAVADFYRGTGIPADRIKVIPNGIQATAQARDRQYLRRELNLSEHDRVIGFVGRLARQKRLEDVIWAFQLLRQVVDRCRLVLIGDGPDRDSLAELAVRLDCRRLTIFTGHRTDAWELMQGFDAFCLASDFEGMSNSLMDAMSLGIPSVVSNIPANRELIRHEQNGLLFTTRKSPELMMNLKRILDDTDFSERLGQTARQFIAENHSVEQMIGNHCQLYEQMLTRD